MGKKVWQDGGGKWLREMIGLRHPEVKGSIGYFCVRNCINSNRFRSSLSTGRFTAEVAKRVANGLGIVVEQLLYRGAVICLSRKTDADPEPI